MEENWNIDSIYILRSREIIPRRRYKTLTATPTTCSQAQNIVSKTQALLDIPLIPWRNYTKEVSYGNQDQ